MCHTEVGVFALGNYTISGRIVLAWEGEHCWNSWNKNISPLMPLLAVVILVDLEYFTVNKEDQ